MINNTTAEYYFIRLCISFLHHVAYAGIFCCLLSLWAIGETAFYFLVYIPLKTYYQNAADHPAPVSRAERKQLFQRCLDTVEQPQGYLEMWFKNAPMSEIKRENLKEFFAWGFMNAGTWSVEEDEELEEYVSEMEQKLGRTIPEGRGKAEALRLTLDKFESLHRSLLWYFCVFVVDTIAFTRLSLNNFHFHRLPLSRTFTLFPFRPLALFSRHVSPSNSLSYWHRPHTSKTKLPIVFIHGIGIGLYPYTKFLNELNHKTEATNSDGDVGLLLIEIMPISFRITTRPLRGEEMCLEIRSILQKHGWDKFVLASHSYGSVISTQLLHDPKLSSMIGPILLIDPVAFLLHLPHVAYNFTVRKPKDANELQLWYFATQDISVAWTLARHFFWTELVLWKEDLRGRKATVSLGGRDLIVNTPTVAKYLSSETKIAANGTNPTQLQEKGGVGDDLNVLWFEQLDHAQVFDKKHTRKVLIDILQVYCSMGTMQPEPKHLANGHG